MNGLDPLGKIDQICDRFESDWLAGQQPRLEDYLGDSLEPFRSELLKELLVSERELTTKHDRRHETVVRPDPRPAWRDQSPTDPTTSGHPYFSTSEAIPSHIGDFHIIREIGRGGMGIVYEAEQSSLGRRVALKVLPGHLLSDDRVRQRFEREARAAGKLHHTNIVPVFAVGTAGGQPFFAMQYIAGRNLEKFSADSETVAGMGLQIANALEHAHRQGIVHRDIKPSNLLLDESGTVWVTDFGLAQVADQQNLTQTGDILGTIRYMPPEAFEGKTDATGDIYSLGLTLYEMVAGGPAYEGKDRNQLVKQVTTAEPPRLGKRVPSVPKDFATIIHKAIDRDPRRRYRTAGEFAADLQRFLADEPIHARRMTSAERLQRWSRRNRGVASSLGVIAFLLIAVSVASTVAAYRFRYVAGEREAARKDAVEASNEATRREKQERWERYRSNLSAAQSAHQLDNLVGMRKSLETAPEEHRNWEWKHLKSRIESSTAVLDNCLAVSTLTKRMAVRSDNAVLIQTVWPTSTRMELPQEGSPSQAWFSDDGKLLAVITTPDHRLHVWDLITQSRVASYTVAPPVQRLRFNPNGQQVYFGSNHGDWLVWKFRDSPSPAILGGQIRGEEVALHFPVSGNRLLKMPEDFKGQLVDTATMKAIADFDEAPLHMNAFSPNGDLFATIDLLHKVRLRNSTTGQLVTELAPSMLTRLPHIRGAWAWTPDGKQLAVGWGHPDNATVIWDVASGKVHARLVGHDNAITKLRISGDGQRVLTASLDNTLRLWDVSSGRLVSVLRGHRAAVFWAEFSPDGALIVSGGVNEPGLRLWDGRTGQLIAYLASDFGSSEMQFSGDSRLLLGLKGGMRVWDVDLARRNGVLVGHTSYVYDVTFSSDGKEIASAAWDGTLRLWNATTGQTLRVLSTTQLGYMRCVQYSPDGKQLVSTEIGQADSDGRTRLWNRLDGKLIDTWTFKADTEDFRACFDPTGSEVVVGTTDGSIRRHREGEQEPVRSWKAHEELPNRPTRFSGTVSDVARSQDGKRLVSGGNDWTVRVWSLEDRQNLAVLRGHQQVITRVAFSPEDRWIASSSLDHQVILWDGASYQEAARLTHGSQVYGMAFSPDGTRLACGCADSTIRLWDLATFQQVAELRGHSAYVHAVAFSPDGTQLVSGSGDKTVRIWDTMSAVERSRK